MQQHEDPKAAKQIEFVTLVAGGKAFASKSRKSAKSGVGHLSPSCRIHHPTC